MPRECQCGWKGLFTDTVKCGGVGPLCPDCFETTERVRFDDHKIALLVNELTSLAVQYGQTQQLRERIAQVIVPTIKDLRDDR